VDFDFSSAPVYTGLTAAVLMLLQIVLMFRVIMQRGKNEVDIGDDGNPDLLQAIRVHANLTENAPIFLIGLGLIEIMAGSTMWVAILGGIFVVARILHAVGFSMSTGVTPGRLIGSLGTIGCIVIGAVYLGYLSIAAM
jgi:uncharacterized membrane protein YecN with MAPEG domain